MDSFLSRFDTVVKGVLSGFDRIRFRGTLRWLANLHGMYAWLAHVGVLLKDFKGYSLILTDQVRESCQQVATAAERPVEFLGSPSVRKEDLAREIARRDNISSGLVCVFSAVEPCVSFSVGPNRELKQLELRCHQRKCLHYYFYLIDPFWGWLNVRLQTWLPFTVQVTANGRERLAHQLLKKGIEFERHGNCFVDVSDVVRAQKLLNQQLRTRWSNSLDRILKRVHPCHSTLFGKDQQSYYWSADETEWATDVMFRSKEDLAEVYPHLLRQATTSFGSKDVLRFLGRRPAIQAFRNAEITSHSGHRVEGTRVKHSINRNSVKMYDKQGSILRVETTINHTREMKVYRASENYPQGPKKYQRLRKGVADLHRRAQISQSSNERYLESLAATETDSTLAQATAKVCERTKWKGRSVRALNPLSESDAKLLEIVNRGEFSLLGFRNRDLREQLFGETKSKEQQKRQAAKVTRLIRMLRAHGIVQKISHTHRYTLTHQGREIITALLTARNANIKKLIQLAA